MNEDNEEMKAREDVVPPAYDDSGLKNSIKNLQKQLSSLKSLSGEIDKLRKEMKTEISNMKKEMKAEFDKMKKEMEAEMQQMKNNLGKWHDHLTYNGSYNVIPKV